MRLLVGLLAALGLVALLAPPAGSEDVAATAAVEIPTSELERRLVQSLAEIRNGQLEGAQRQLDELLISQPDFRLAHLIRGDLWMAHAAGLKGFGHQLSSGDVENLRLEARARWERYRRMPPPAAMPSALIKVPEGAPSALVVDLRRNRLFVFESRNDRLLRTRDFYVSIGRNGSDKQREGDERTPVGVYLVSSYLAGSGLPDLYGVGAFPISYPNGWDRLKGRTGSGIWIHGTESTTYSRPPRSSRGCVTLSNQDFAALRQVVEVKETPVLVADALEWVSSSESAGRRRSIEQVVERWRRDWESRDTDRYLDHYSDSFRTEGMDLEAFAVHKQRVNESKEFIRVGLEDVGIYAYPGESDLVVVDFLQRYQSDSFRSARRKHQYWRRENGAWRIVFEEKV